MSSPVDFGLMPDSADLESLVTGLHHNPHELLGAHSVRDGDGRDRAVDQRTDPGIAGIHGRMAVRDAVKAQGKVFESLGCIVEEAEPDFRDANECFLTWRHWAVELDFGDILEANADKLNEYVHWHVQEGRKLTGPQLARVEAKRTDLYQRMRAFMEKYEFFLLPVNQVLPFDVKTHYPTRINGVEMENYIAWMKSAYYISTVGNPAMGVPCAFSPSGLPIGLQIVGRHNDDWGVLQMAYAFEQATNAGKRRPPIL